MRSKFCLLFLLVSGLSFARSIVPSRIVTPSLDLFNSSNKTLPNGDVEVRVTTYSKGGDFRRNGSKQVLNKSQYEAYRKLSLPVFEMIPNDRFKSDAEYGRRGTAFSIGENLVLTNQHVLDPKQKNTTSCGDFEVKNHEGNEYDCKKVHFCSLEHDICLVEMKPLTKTKRDCLFCEGTKYDASLAVGPKLKLKAHYSPEDPTNEVLTAIGNSMGYGIHFSQGRGVWFRNDRVYFYAPISVGNSGGALLNNEGFVVGVVKAETKILISDDPNKVYNLAASTDIVIRLVREALRDDPETLEKFNRSVVE